jgi:hypothetical protein
VVARFLPWHKNEVRPLCAGRPVSLPIVAASLAISIPPPPTTAPAPMAPAAAPSPMAPLDLRDGIGRLCEVVLKVLAKAPRGRDVRHSRLYPDDRARGRRRRPRIEGRLTFASTKWDNSRKFRFSWRTRPATIAG